MAEGKRSNRPGPGRTATVQPVVDRDVPVLKGLGLQAAGTSDLYPGFREEHPSSRCSSLLACVGGAQNAWVDGQWLPLRAGHAYLVPAGAAYGLRHAGNRACRLAWVAYGPGRSDAIAAFTQTQLILPADGRPLRAAIRELYRETLGPRRTELLAHWAGTVEAVARSLLAGPPVLPRLAAVWQRVDEDLARPWTVDQLADEMEVTRQYFCRLCRRELGRTARGQLEYLRMHRAAAMLVTTSQTLTVIARQVGYEDPFSFSRAFKRARGVSPSAYRGRHRA